MIAYIHVAIVNVENINIFLGVEYGRSIRMMWLGADTIISFLVYKEMRFYAFCSDLHNLRGGV